MFLNLNSDVMCTLLSFSFCFIANKSFLYMIIAKWLLIAKLDSSQYSLWLLVEKVAVISLFIFTCGVPNCCFKNLSLENDIESELSCLYYIRNLWLFWYFEHGLLIRVVAVMILETFYS